MATTPISVPREPPVKSTTSVKDPVCGRLIEPTLAVVKSEHNGRTKYFCGAPCKELFEAHPGRYANIPESVWNPPDACILQY